MNSITRRRFLGAAGMAAVAPAVGAMGTQTNQTVATSSEADRGAVSIEKNVVFGKGGDIDLHLDIYRPPAGTANGMATIHIHGGGFTGGSKETLTERASPFAALGFVAIPVQYRLTGQAKWPAQIEDVKAAIRWVRANAKSLGINPDLIGVVGHSAGGQLALFAAGTPNRPEFEGKNGTPGAGTQLAACCAYYPSTEVRLRADGTVSNLMPAGSDEAAHRAASPLSYIAKGYPPTVIFHGTADTTIPLENSERLFKQLRDAQVPVEFHAFEGVPHVFDSNPEFAKAAAGLAHLFIDRKVLHPRAFAPAGGGGGGRGRG
jgi:acetyl esterase/lipase